MTAPCARTLSGVHVFARRDGGSKGDFTCICSAVASAEEAGQLEAIIKAQDKEAIEWRANRER